MSQHREGRLKSVLSEELTKMIERYFERPVGSIVTITDIDVSEDSSRARIGVSVFPDKMAEGVLNNLKGFAGELHHKLIRAMNIRTVPILDFYLDKGFENAASVEKIMMDLENKDQFDKDRP